MSTSRQLRIEEQAHDAETVTNEYGGQSSKTSFDFTLLPSIQGLFDVIKILTDNCKEYGGKYSRGNWKTVTENDNFNHLIQHVFEAYEAHSNADTSSTYEHVNHAICRLMFLQYSLLEELDNDD
jgi:hypothetical protein